MQKLQLDDVEIIGICKTYTSKRIAAVQKEIDDIKGRVDTCYGFHIDGTESDPESAVTYLADAVGMTPAHMDYTNGVFDYGSWEDAFFMPRPCMLKSDGTVDYYLNPNDYTKKEDGTASDIGDLSYDGNAMMEWGKCGRKIWMKINPLDSGKSANVWISNYKIDEDFHDWSFHNCKGESAQHFYTAIYPEMIDTNSKMRSISGQQATDIVTPVDFITAATANNATLDELWNIECFADRLLINMLLVLIGKSLDSQTVYGMGTSYGGSTSANERYRTGVHNNKGLFYGTNDGRTESTFSNVVKIFGMENYYGFRSHIVNGYMYNNTDGVILLKFTYGNEDGSNTTGYNTTGEDYVEINPFTFSGANDGFIDECLFDEKGMFPKSLNGSDSTYYCDSTSFSTLGVAFAAFGGGSGTGGTGGTKNGIFKESLTTKVNSSTWTTSTSLSCRPLQE